LNIFGSSDAMTDLVLRAQFVVIRCGPFTSSLDFSLGIRAGRYFLVRTLVPGTEASVPFPVAKIGLCIAVRDIKQCP